MAGSYCPLCRVYPKLMDMTSVTEEVPPAEPERKEKTTEMTTTYPALGDHHIRFSLRGTPIAIAQFHALLAHADSDWPFSREHGIRLCTRCFGVVWSRPRLNPEDLKATARQIGNMKVKIRHFHKDDKCTRGTERPYQLPVQWISAKLAHKLYGMDGVNEVLKELKIPGPGEKLVTLPSTGKTMVVTPNGEVIVPGIGLEELEPTGLTDDLNVGGKVYVN